jgi:Secretion system C-terminal sorting domain
MGNHKFLNIIFLLLYFNTNAQLNNSANIVTGANTFITVDNLNLINNGVLNQSAGTWKFSGNINSTIGGTTVAQFYRLQLAKNTGNSLQLLSNIQVSNELQFTSGLLNLNTKNIILSPAALLTGETETSRITGTNGGYVEITIPLNAPNAVNAGNLGVTITSAQNLGSTVIRRGHVAQTDAGTPNFSINRYFDINPANNTSLNATLRINYFDAELNGKNEASLSVWKSTDNSNWSYAGFSTRNAASNFVEANSIASFSRWTLSDKFATGIFDLPNGRNSLQVWPNPFMEWITVGIESTKPTKANLQVFNMLGQIVYAKPLLIVRGKNIFPVKIAAFAKGVYQLIITGNEGSNAIIPLVKQ